MLRTTYITVLILCVAISFGCGNRAAVAEEIAAPVREPELFAGSASGLLAAAGDARFLGARSCAASGCHGSLDPDPRFTLSRRNEFIFWLDKDPHARAARTLANATSEQILRRLHILDEQGAVRDQAALANCYGCHNPQPAAKRQYDTFFTRDGVSCEMCHGAAEKWIGPHVSAEWPQMKEQGSAAALGFLDTEDTLVRAQTCAQCHVGSSGREVNHDLIAAGHPALKFELTAYHDMLPKHWRDGEARQQNPDLELELWSAGQVASIETALKLLNSRAQRASDQSPGAVWPEFAEYDCYACHHDLAHPSWRQKAAPGGSPLGMAAWGGWYFGLLTAADRETLRPLMAEMQRGFGNDPAAVQQAIAGVRFDRKAFDKLIREGHYSAVPEPTNWDQATQLYLAMVAAEQAIRDKTSTVDEATHASILDVRQRLAFPHGFDSPQGVFAISNEQTSREAVVGALEKLKEQLQHRRSE